MILDKHFYTKSKYFLRSCNHWRRIQWRLDLDRCIHGNKHNRLLRRINRKQRLWNRICILLLHKNNLRLQQRYPICDINTREKTTQKLKPIGASVYGQNQIIIKSINRSGCNSFFELLGFNKAKLWKTKTISENLNQRSIKKTIRNHWKTNIWNSLW